MVGWAPARICFVRASRARACRQGRESAATRWGEVWPPLPCRSYVGRCRRSAPLEPVENGQFFRPGTRSDAEHRLRLLVPTVSRQALRYLDWAVDYSNPLREGRPAAPGASRLGPQRSVNRRIFDRNLWSTCNVGRTWVTEGTRTPDLQGHNLAL
jgi:hypothetical protein